MALDSDKVNISVDLSDGEVEAKNNDTNKYSFKETVSGTMKITVYGDGYLPTEKNFTILAGKKQDEFYCC